MRNILKKKSVQNLLATLDESDKIFAMLKSTDHTTIVFNKDDYKVVINITPDNKTEEAGDEEVDTDDTTSDIQEEEELEEPEEEDSTSNEDNDFDENDGGNESDNDDAYDKPNLSIIKALQLQDAMEKAEKEEKHHVHKPVDNLEIIKSKYNIDESKLKYPHNGYYKNNRYVKPVGFKNIGPFYQKALIFNMAYIHHEKYDDIAKDLHVSITLIRNLAKDIEKSVGLRPLQYSKKNEEWETMSESERMKTIRSAYDPPKTNAVTIALKLGITVDDVEKYMKDEEKK